MTTISTNFTDITTAQPQQGVMLEEKTRKSQDLSFLLRVLKAPVYPFKKIFSGIASEQGIGPKEKLRAINPQNRAALLGELRGENIQFGFKKGSLLEGMYFKAESENSKSKTMLICSGSHASFETYTVPMVRALKSRGYDVMVFNYEGFGQSEGKASEEGVYKSAEAAYQYLKQVKGCEDENIVVWGYSLGSGAASDLASKHKISVVLDRGFSSMSEVAYHQAPGALKGLAKMIFYVGAHFDNLNKLKNAEGKISIAQGIYDSTMMSEYHGEVLKEKLEKKPNFQYLEVSCGHKHQDNNVWFDNREDESIQRFFDEI